MSSGQDHDETPSSPDIHFEPIVNLAKVDVKTLEENEEEMIKMRAKLFRYIIGQHDSAPEWKERGIGDVKILKGRAKHSYRLVMRREKTLKVCANHFLTKDMELKPNCGSDRAWVWNVSADFADEEPRKETLAIRFANAENAKKFKEVFDKCKGNLEVKNPDLESEKLASELESLKVNDTNEKPNTEQEDKQEESKQESGKDETRQENGKEDETTQENGKDETKQANGKDETKQANGKDETKQEDSKSDETKTDSDIPSDKTAKSPEKGSEGGQ